MITPKHAAALRAYRYAGQDRSILYHYVLSPWAQLLVDVATPPWLAPNAITFLGLLPPVLTLVIALQAQPELGQGMAGWVALLCAASMFVYSTLDNMDGKQARKTGSSSALGLLFDHGACLLGLRPPPLLARSRALSRLLGHTPLLPPLRRLRRRQRGAGELGQHSPHSGRECRVLSDPVLVHHPRGALFLCHVGGAPHGRLHPAPGQWPQ